MWPLAVMAATCLKNIRLTKAIPENKTPYELWHGKKASVNELRVFGSEARAKGHPKSQRTIFLGYSDQSKGWIFLNLTTWKLFTSGDAHFNEHVFPTYHEDNSVCNKTRRRAHSPASPNHVHIPSPAIDGTSHDEPEEPDRDLNSSLSFLF